MATTRNLTQQQLLAEAKESAQWARTRAGELLYFAEGLPAELAGLAQNPGRRGALFQAYKVYVEELEAQARRARSVYEALSGTGPI